MVTRTRKLKALILVGGLGSRLKPITFTTPKPLVPFMNKPMLEHQIGVLSDAGVSEVILAMNYKYRHIISSVESFVHRYGVPITYSLEDEPLGTAGPISLARNHLSDSTFFVMNSDIICSFPLLEMLEFHREAGVLGTILSTTTEDPKKFGVIRTSPGSCIVEEFIEKPSEHVGNRINAGIYILECEALGYFEPKPSSIEKEVFPVLASMHRLCTYDLQGFWMDIGTLEGYLEAQRLYFESADRHKAIFGKKACRGQDSWVACHGRRRVFGTGVDIDAQAEVGDYVTLGDGVSVGRGSRLEDCAVFSNTQIGDGVWIRRSIVGKGCSIRGRICISYSIIGDSSVINGEGPGCL